jgi:tellurite resistance protein TerC
MNLFRYLSYGLSAILIFIGAKMIASFLFNWHPEHWQSLLVIVSLLAVSIVASLIAERREKKAEKAAEELNQFKI